MSEDFENSYLGRLRKVIGTRMVLMPGARCVIQAPDGRILLHLRGDFRLWGLPAGFCEPGESALETLVREVHEETGLTVLDPVPWGYASVPEETTMVYPNGDTIQGFGLDFAAWRWEGELHADGTETMELGWFPLDGLPDMIPPHQACLSRFRTWLETGNFQLA